VRAARQCFADFGYAGTSNRHVAEASGLTTGAIYHYFASKQALYLAAHEGVQEQIYDRFEKAVEEETSLLGEIGAMLDEAVQLNREDPSLARFLVTRNIDVERYPELAPVAAESSRRVAFFRAMFERAIARDELRPEAAPPLLDVIRTITAGLVFAASNDVELQARSVEAIKLVLSGDLLGKGPNGPI
jgi:TetR/AcrR family transcriptional repressor of uid operon